jgi:hypothetical protein
MRIRQKQEHGRIRLGLGPFKRGEQFTGLRQIALLDARHRRGLASCDVLWGYFEGAKETPLCLFAAPFAGMPATQFPLHDRIIGESRDQRFGILRRLVVALEGQEAAKQLDSGLGIVRLLFRTTQGLPKRFLCGVRPNADRNGAMGRTRGAIIQDLLAAERNHRNEENHEP